MTKRSVCLLLALGLLCALLSGCGSAAPEAEAQTGPRVVCTIFPLWDWTRNLMDAEAGQTPRLLLDSGVDMHSFQPGVEDLVAVSSCDLLIYVGGESDDWIADALAERTNPNGVALNLLELLGEAALDEEEPEGAEAHDHGPERDEHIWLSLANARTLCAAITEALCRVDAAGAEGYRERLAAYDARLAALEGDYAAFSAALHRENPEPQIVFADRFPFRYLTEELDLSCWAAFSGCSAETEASFETVVFLAGKAEAAGARAVFVTESPVPGVAETVAKAAGGLPIRTLDSLQSVRKADVEGGVTYLGVMETNLKTLREALL